MHYLLTLFLFLSLPLSANSFEDFKKDQLQGSTQQEKDFKTYTTESDKNFQNYKKAMDKAYSDYKKSLSKYWDKPKLSTQKTWVSYTKDKKTRSEVDFKNNILQVETIASSKEEALEKIQKRLDFTIGASTKDVIKEDSLQNTINKLSLKSATSKAKIDTKPILTPVLFAKKPTKKEINAYSKFLLSKLTLKKKKSKIANSHIYLISVSLPTDTTLKRSKVYLQEVKKQAKRFDMPSVLVLAIMQTESDFNPFAKSHIPAYGLMQIVPKSAGADTYNFLYHQKRRPSSTYLYNSKNNIEMGSAYLHILYYRYLKKIKNPQSRLYCTIAAYNTGAGNIAWAFTKTHNMNTAAPKINILSSKEVYKHLLSHLKYDEPKQYLKRVTKRMGAFKKAYSTII